MKNANEKFFENGALSRLGKKAALLILSLCLALSVFQNIDLRKAFAADSVSGSDITVVSENETPKTDKTEDTADVEPSKSAADAEDTEIVSDTDKEENSKEEKPDADASDKSADSDDSTASGSDVGIASGSDIGAVSGSDAESELSGTDIDSEIGEMVDQVMLASETLLAAAPPIAEGTSGNCTWVIDAEGVMTIAPIEGTDGVLARYDTNLTSWGWKSYKADVKELVVKPGVVGANDMTYAFNMKNCTAMDLSGLDTSNVTDMYEMFSSCANLTSLDLSGFDTSNVTDMSYMFEDCVGLTSVQVSGWDTSSVTTMYSMFSGCESLTSVDVSNWDVSSVTNMGSMFENCKELRHLDVGNWKPLSGPSMSAMFQYCGIESFNGSNWDVSNVVGMSEMFAVCSNLTELDLNNWDVSKVKYMNSMINSCKNLTKLDISGWKMSGKSNMQYAFFANDNLTTIVVGAGFKPGSNYSRHGSYHFFNVVDETLIYTPKNDGYGVKSVTIHDGGKDIEVDLTKYPGSYPGFTGDMTATIVFMKETDLYTVYFDANGGSGSMRSQKLIHDIPKKLNANTFTRDSFEFLGWHTDKDATTPLYTDEQEVVDIIDIGKTSITLYAVWEKIYTVYYDANGGEGTMAPQSIRHGNAVKLSKNTFAREGGEFLGWHTDKNAKTPLYTDEQEVTDLFAAKDSITLYAIWKGDFVDITVSAAGVGGSVSPESETIPKGRNFEIEITLYNDRCAVSKITVNGTAIDLSALSGTGLDRVLTLESVQENTEVVVIFEMESNLGEPKIVFEKESKTFDIGEEIKFTAIGVWPDEYYYPTAGDAFYVPMAWHHAEPSGDWDEVVDPYFDYSASFTQSAAGKYTLKVEFMPLVVTEDFDLIPGEIVTLEAEYVVKGEVLGENDNSGGGENSIPETGDDYNKPLVISLVAGFAVILAVCIVSAVISKKKKNAAENTEENTSDAE